MCLCDAGESTELERLREHHSWSKEEFGRNAIEKQRWFYRFVVAGQMLVYLNKLNPWWYEEDLAKEIKMRVDDYLEKYKKV